MARSCGIRRSSLTKSVKRVAEDISDIFCLWIEGNRGSEEKPGLMLAIDDGGNCEGLAFRIQAEKLDHETFVLFRREILFSSYHPTWLSLDAADGPIEALGFVANQDHEMIIPSIPLHDQAKMGSRAGGSLAPALNIYQTLMSIWKSLVLKIPTSQTFTLWWAP